MSNWEQLELELAKMFDEYTWRRDDYDRAIERHVAADRAARAEYESQPARKRQVREAAKKWRERNKEHYLALQRANTKRWRAKNAEKNRKYMREYMREYSKRKRAEAALAKAA